MNHVLHTIDESPLCLKEEFHQIHEKIEVHLHQAIAEVAIAASQKFDQIKDEELREMFIQAGENLKQYFEIESKELLIRYAATTEAYWRFIEDYLVKTSEMQSIILQRLEESEKLPTERMRELSRKQTLRIAQSYFAQNSRPQF